MPWIHLRMSMDVLQVMNLLEMDCIRIRLEEQVSIISTR